MIGAARRVKSLTFISYVAELECCRVGCRFAQSRAKASTVYESRNHHHHHRSRRQKTIHIFLIHIRRHTMIFHSIFLSLLPSSIFAQELSSFDVFSIQQHTPKNTNSPLLSHILPKLIFFSSFRWEKWEVLLLNNFELFGRSEGFFRPHWRESERGQVEVGVNQTHNSASSRW